VKKSVERERLVEKKRFGKDICVFLGGEIGIYKTYQDNEEGFVANNRKKAKTRIKEKI